MHLSSKRVELTSGASSEISINNLVEFIPKLTGFRDKSAQDTSQPDGQPCCMLDTAQANIESGFNPKTSFEDGLRNTIKWYPTVS